jgi:hypothetical protein
MPKTIVLIGTATGMGRATVVSDSSSRAHGNGKPSARSAGAQK